MESARYRGGGRGSSFRVASPPGRGFTLHLRQGPVSLSFFHSRGSGPGTHDQGLTLDVTPDRPGVGGGRLRDRPALQRSTKAAMATSGSEQLRCPTTNLQGRTFKGSVPEVLEKRNKRGGVPFPLGHRTSPRPRIRVVAVRSLQGTFDVSWTTPSPLPAPVPGLQTGGGEIPVRVTYPTHSVPSTSPV